MKHFDIHLCSILCFSCIKGPLVCIFPSYILHDMQYNVFGRIEAHTKDIFVFWHDYVCVCVCLIFAWVFTRDINESENKHWKRWKFLSNFCVSSFLCSFPFIEKHLQVIAWSTSFHSYHTESAMIMYVY